MVKSKLYSLTAAFALSLTSSTAFAAIDAADVLSRLSAQLEKQGIELDADSATLQGDNNVLLSGVELGLGGGESIDIPQLPLQGVVESNDGSYLISRIGLPSFSTNSGGARINFEGAVIEGYLIASPEVNDPILSAGFYKKMTFGELSIGQGNNGIFAFSGGEVNVSDYQQGGTITYDMALNDMVFNTSGLRGNAKQTFAGLGYEQINGNIKAEGSWDTSSGLMSLSPMVIATEDAADITIDLSIGGYTPQLVAAMQEIQKQNAGNEQAQGMAMLGLMQQIDIRKLSIAMDDNSITGRLLDFFGGQQGMNRESTVAFAKGMLPLGLARLGNQDFSTMATAAIGQFLDDPKNLTIAAEPENPVPAAQVFGTFAGGNPGGAIDLLGVTVTANQ